MKTKQHSEESEFKRNLSPVGALSLAFGCMIGWNAFVLPGSTLLPRAGLAGTMVAMLLAIPVLLVIAANVQYMLCRHPRAGGAYSYTKLAFGYDHAFLCAWLLALSYIAFIPLCASALGSTVRNMMAARISPDLGYGLANRHTFELLAAAGVLIVLCALCCLGIRFTGVMQSFLSLLLLGGLFACAILLLQDSGIGLSHTNTFLWAKQYPVWNILSVTAVFPWLFAGFESVSQEASEFWFPSKKLFSILSAASVLGAAVYILLGWITAHQQMSIAAWRALLLAALAAILTGIVGFLTAASRLLRTLSADGLLPHWFGRLNRHQVPANAILFITIVSAVILFVGESALSWIADLACCGIITGYGYTSAAAYRLARSEDDRRAARIGLAGIVLSVLMAVLLLVPNHLAAILMHRESYLLLAIWITAGLAFYWVNLRKRPASSGYPTMLAVTLALLVIYSLTAWFIRTVLHETETHAAAQYEVSLHLIEGSLVQLALTLATLFIMFEIHRTIRRQNIRTELEKITIREGSKAKSAFFSNMSHDIRTPMNAIIGFTNLAIQNKDDPEKTQDYLAKIRSSSNQLLAFVNDVLEMSRIENGISQLDATECNLSELLHDVTTLIIGQVQEKNLELWMSTINVTDEYIYCDKLRFSQILVNLLSNAIKFTPEGGKISLCITQTAEAPEGYGSYELVIQDTGIGMAPELADQIFEPFKREGDASAGGTSGTGLGMAITKNIVDLMHGVIDVDTTPGEGTKFTVRLDLRLQNNLRPPHIAEMEKARALVVDSDPNACSGAAKLLMNLGMHAEWTISGQEALKLTKTAIEDNDRFAIYVIDQHLPELSGLDVCRQLQKLCGDQPPIIILTTYDWLAVKQEALSAGVSGFCKKPVFMSDLRLAVSRVVGNMDFTEEPEQTETEAAQGEDGGIQFAGRRMLLVDDNELNREVATAILEPYGILLDEAVNGADAVEKLRSAKSGLYDAVLMDIQMPVMNGYEATKAIRALEDPQLNRIPIIAMTANAFEEDKRDAANAGMNGHIAKPIDIDQLLELLGQILL